MELVRWILGARLRLARGEDVLVNFPAVIVVLMLLGMPRLMLCLGVIAWACGYRFSLRLSDGRVWGQNGECA